MLKEIQYLRGVAALMVVIYHTRTQLMRIGYDGPGFPIMSAGVDVFFVVSGFIMTYISYDRSQPAGTFLRDRFLRIAPLYWILTCTVAVIGIATPEILQTSIVPIGYFVASMLFLPAPHPVFKDLFPLLPPGWTLNYEMYFYLVFSFFVGMTMHYRYLFAVLTIVALTAIAAASPLAVVSKFYGNSIVLEFAFGIGLGVIYCRRGLLLTFRHGSLIGACVSFGGFALLIGLATLNIVGWRAGVMGLPAAIMVVGALIGSRAARPLKSRLLEKIGNASYSLYLTHFIIMAMVGRVSHHIMGSDAPSWFYPIFVIYSSAICVVVAIQVFERVELPLHMALKRRFVPRRAIA